MYEVIERAVGTTNPQAQADPHAVEIVEQRVVEGPGLGVLGRPDPSLLRQHAKLGARGAAAGSLGVALALVSPGPTPSLVIVAVIAGVLLHVLTLGLPPYERETSAAPCRRLALLGSTVALVSFALALAPASVVRLAMLVGVSVIGPVWVLTLLLRLRRGQSSALLVGDQMSVYHLINQWRQRTEINLVGVCLTESEDDIQDSAADVLGVPIVGRLRDAADLAVQAQVAHVVVAPGRTLSAYDVRRLSWALEDTTIELSVAAEVHGALPHRIAPRVLGRRLVLSVRPSKRSAVASAVKSGMDHGLGLVLLLLFAPVIALLVLVIRVDSVGPGLFKQQRAGKNGRLFWMYKLRTMDVHAEEHRADLAAIDEGTGPMFKVRGDPRVTRVGDVLRKTSFDELPQLINVVRGEMSLIGPRPALPTETEQYDDWIRRRLSVRPGMTGLWQVSGRSDLPWQEAVRLDLEYVDNWTNRYDLGIVARTLKAVVQRQGAL